jgi:hypothetical protein
MTHHVQAPCETRMRELTVFEGWHCDLSNFNKICDKCWQQLRDFQLSSLERYGGSCVVPG